MDQRIVHVEHFDTRHPFIQPGQPGIVFPQGVCGGTDICLELAGVSDMQVPHGGGQHDDITGTLE